jgi:hypothetical protein
MSLLSRIHIHIVSDLTEALIISYTVVYITEVSYPHFQIFYIHDCIINDKSFCKIEHYLYIFWIREKFYNVNITVVSLTSF